MRISGFLRMRNRRGNAMLEAALATPMLIGLLATVVDIGRAFYFSDIAAGAARAGAQYGIISSANTGNVVGMQEAAKDEHARQVPDSKFTVQADYFCQDSGGTEVDCATNPNAEAYVKVVTHITYDLIVPWNQLGWFGALSNPMTIGGISVMRVQ
jgi:Flp pilus assembly protein TadG